MNKQELIERIEVLKNLFGNKAEYIEIDMVIRLISELDEPQKPVVVPRCVADYIKDAKYYEWDLDDVFDHIAEEPGDSEISIWFYTPGNVDVFARAWLDGYEVEKEKRYFVKLKAVDQYLVRNEDENFLGFLQSRLKSKFTRKQLEQAELGWVFDCPGVEIDEV